MKKILSKVYEDYKNLDVLKFINESLTNNKKEFIITINPEIVMYAEKDDKYKQIIMNQNYKLIPDSIGIEYSIKKLLNKKIKRYPGVDLLVEIFNVSNGLDKSLYLFGGTEEVNKDMEKYINKNYKNIKIVGRSNGYIDDYNNVQDEIIKLKPDVIAVALGAPKQEIFINSIFDKLKKGIMIGVGGSFDTLTNNKKRAPKIFRKLKLEWLYRLIQNPKRIKRFYTNNIKFMIELSRVKK